MQQRQDQLLIVPMKKPSKKFSNAQPAYIRVAGGGWKRGNIMPSSNFHCDGVHLFLTYPRCALEREQLRDLLLGIEPSAQYCIGRELHSDGTPHLHAYVHWGRRRRFARVDAFDLDGHHPNIQRPRRAKDVISYCRKEDATPLVSVGLEDVGTGEPSSWGECLEVSNSKDEFLALVRARFPRDYVLNLERLLFFCEQHFGSSETVYSGRSRSEFREPATLTAWVAQNVMQV